MGQWQTNADKLLRPMALVIPLGLLWAVALGAGAFGVFQLLSEGHKATATGAYIPWGLWVALYIFFVESAAGMHLASSLGTVYRWRPFVRILKLNLFLSFIFAIGGLSLIALDLGRLQLTHELDGLDIPGLHAPPGYSARLGVRG
jgi:molybdopterin-containing oxidoreductase family membrane subunit